MNYKDWKRNKVDIFWGEIAPCDHVVQIYENDNVFLEALAGFALSGFAAGECVIVIATQAHLHALETHLKNYGHKVNNLVYDNQYIPLDAEKTLSKFMVDGWPDKDLFNKTVSEVINKASLKKRRVRAFGEMVALLWAQGHSGATVSLENLWNKFCEKQSFSLFCAYPKSGFTQDINESINHICNCHSKMIGGFENSFNEVVYRSTN